MMVRRSQGMGIIPFLAPLFAMGAGSGATAGGALAAGAGAGVYAYSCDDWYCWDNIKRSLFYDPETPPLGPVAVPAAPQSKGSMSLPGAWSFEDMMRHTTEAQKAFIKGTTYNAEIAKQATRGGSPPTPEEEETEKFLLIAAAGVAAIFGLALIMKR